MKKTVFVLLLLALAASLVFAGGSRAASGGTGPQTITLMHFMGEQAKRDGLQSWCDEITRRDSQIRFDITPITDAPAYLQLIRTKIAAGDPADIMMGAVRDYLDLIDAGHIADITNKPYMRNYDPEIISASAVNGKVYGIPIDMGLILVFYNKDIFARYNLQVPRTYAEFIRICETLRSNNVNPLSLGFRDRWMAGADFMMDWYQVLNKNRDMFVEIDAGRRKFADYPEFRRAMERARQRLALATANPFGTNNDHSIQAFARGDAAMLPNGTWSISTVRELGPQGNFGLFCLPADNEADSVARLFVDDAFMISSRTTKTAAIDSFFEYALSTEGMNIWVENTKLSPAVKGITIRSPDSMLIDANAVISSGKTIFADVVPGPVGSLFDILCNVFSPNFLADQSRSIDQHLAELDFQYAEQAAAIRAAR